MPKGVANGPSYTVVSIEEAKRVYEGLERPSDRRVAAVFQSTGRHVSMSTMSGWAAWGASAGQRSLGSAGPVNS